MPLTEEQWELKQRTIQVLGEQVMALLGSDLTSRDELVGESEVDPQELLWLNQVFTVVPLIWGYVESYTRGNGFIDGIPAGDLQGVIVTATARATINPVSATSHSESDVNLMLSHYPGGFQAGVQNQPDSPAWQVGTDGKPSVVAQMPVSNSWSFNPGFTEMEKAVLHKYRIRNA